MKKFLILLSLWGLVCIWDTTILSAHSDNVIVFSGNITGNWDIWTYDMDNRKLHRITNTQTDETNPIWLKDKKSIAYLRNGTIYIWKKGKEHQLTSHGTYRYLFFEPQKNRIIFSKFDEEEADIGYINLSGRKKGIFFKLAHQQIHACIAPDGKKLYFVEGYLEDNRVVQEIWSAELESGDLQLLYKGKDKPFFRPDIGPDGTRLIFVTGNQNSMALCSGNTEGKHYEELKATCAPFVDYPCWSSDGQKVLYTALVNNRQQLAVYDFEKKNVQFLEIDGECKDGKW